LRDVLLEYQLTRPSDAHAALRELLDPLDRNPDLQHTLEVYLANDLDRRQTATTLHVHPNTLDYRLRRIVELTGLDPSTSRGLQLLGAALAARQLSDP
jgi:DNA-binding PucR family transcriptional regulator